MPPDPLRDRRPVADPPAAPIGAASTDESASPCVPMDRALERALLTPALRRRVFVVALKVLGDRHEAEDVAQDAITTAWCRADSLRSLDRLEGWVITIARNLAIDRRRGRFSADRRPLYVAEWSDQFVAEPICTRAYPSLCQLGLADALATLTDGERRCLEGRLYGHSNRDLARIENTTNGAIKGRIHRAKRKFEEVLL